MTEKYTVAIIGCGRLGQHYAEVYQTLPNTELVAIADTTPSAARPSASASAFPHSIKMPKICSATRAPIFRSSCSLGNTSKKR